MMLSGQVSSAISISNNVAESWLLGQYDSATLPIQTYAANSESLSQYVVENISATNLRSYTESMIAFHNRNTFSDTISNSIGIGAARRWLYEEIASLPASVGGRMAISYMDFSVQDVCGDTDLRNVFAILPGTKGADSEIVIIVAHFDTRCEQSCNVDCLAEGADDNTSGSALLLESCRVLSAHNYENTIVFLWTVGEEQGLYGATAFADYALLNSLPIRAVLNNDVVGGILCGETSSAPSCPEFGAMDSTHLRIFSYGIDNSIHKNIARYVVQNFEEHLQSCLEVNQELEIFPLEDRVGRGGDHIPFRMNGYPAIRFTSSYEHGDGHPDAMYNDHQHTSEDVLGMDTDSDGVLDSLFIHFPYLQRNTAIVSQGAASLAMAANKPEYEFFSQVDGNFLVFNIADSVSHFRCGIRSSNELVWENYYSNNGEFIFEIPSLNANEEYIINVSSIDELGYHSLATDDIIIQPIYNSNNSISTTYIPGNTDCNSTPIETLFFKPAPLRIWPNPVKSLLNISVEDKNLHDAELIIYDVLGHIVVHHQAIEIAGGENLQCNTSVLSNGIYMLYLRLKDGGLLRGRMVVQHI